MTKQDLDSRTWTFADIETHPLAQRFGLTEKAARRSLAAGRLHGARPGGRVWHFENADIEAWVNGSRSDAQR